MNGIETAVLVIVALVIGKLISKASKRNAVRKKPKVKKKGGWNDEHIIERLTKHELKLRPQLSKKEARKSAMDRWQRDMR